MVSTNGAHTAAIVGGGAIGAALFDALVARLSAETSLRVRPRIVLFERSERVGRGVAYANDEAPYLLNQSAQTMSLVPRRRGHFCEWLERSGALRPNGEELFCPRRLFGDYVEDCFARAVEKARRRGIVVTIVRDEVTTLVPRPLGGHRVLTKDHAPLDAGAVVLAVGNVRSTKFRALEGPRFFSSPYPGAALRRIPPRARVAVLGTGLSAIDATLALFAAGHEGTVTMASRGGLLPAVRGPLPRHDLRHVTRENVLRATDGGRAPLRFATLLRWLELEFQESGAAPSWERDFPAWVEPLERMTTQVAAAERGPRLAQSIGEALNPMIEVLWHHLADDEKRLFLDRFHGRFMSHWVPIPLVTGRRVLDLLREGKLVALRGLRGASFDAERSTHRLELDSGVREFDWVIDATGVPRHLADCDSPLLHALVAQKTIAAHPLGGLRVDFDTLRVVAEDGRVDPGLYAIGNLTSGTHLFTSTLEQNVDKADRIAAQIVADLDRRTEKDPHVDATPHPPEAPRVDLA